METKKYSGEGYYDVNNNIRLDRLRNKDVTSFQLQTRDLPPSSCKSGKLRGLDVNARGKARWKTTADTKPFCYYWKSTYRKKTRRTVARGNRRRSGSRDLDPSITPYHTYIRKGTSNDLVMLQLATMAQIEKKYIDRIG